MREISIDRIQPQHIDEVKILLTSDEPAYRRYFQAFDFQNEAWPLSITAAQKDQYWMIRVGQILSGIFMLRGLDKGYAVPAFGVYISQAFAEKGLSKVALNYSISWCMVNGFKEIMLTVHPDNATAYGLYEKAGFQFAGQYSDKGHVMLKKKLSPHGDVK